MTQIVKSTLRKKKCGPKEIELLWWLRVKEPACSAGDTETRVSSLGREDPLEKGMVTHSSILAWRIPWTEEPGQLQSTGLQRVGHDYSDLAHSHTQSRN